MRDVTVIAEWLRNEWNQVQPMALDLIKNVSEEELADDLVFVWLAKVEYPWRLGVITLPPLEGRIAATELAEFKINIERDRKMMACVTSFMAQLLRLRTKDCVVAIFDKHLHGFSVKHKGADDMEVQELFPATVPN